MSSDRNQFRAGVAALAASILLAPALMAGQGSTAQPAGDKAAPKAKAVAPQAKAAAPKAKAVTPRKAPARRTAPAAKRAPSASGRKQATHTASKGKRRLSPRQQRARLHLEPDRTQEIQRALAQAGYLHEEATGTWDAQTREAMRRYQADHGFPATGLPEAKSLMKLGLGPHPLPPELDASVKAQANADPAAKDVPSPDPPPSAQRPTAGTPPQK